MSRYIVFAIGSLSFLLVSISGTSVSVAFPVITQDFGVSLMLAGWVLNVQQLAGTAIMPLAGKAGDIFGAKKCFLISTAVFTIGSLLCAMATNIYFLIGARFIQAIGAGGFLPLMTAIASDLFPNSRQQAIGLFSSIFPIGMIIGPNIGGWLVEAYGWQSVFWINIPLGIAVFIAMLIMLKESKREKGQLDLVGAGLFTGMLSAFLIALNEIGNNDTGSPWLVAGILFAASAVMGILFFRRESRVKDPVIDLKLLKEGPFFAANAYNFLYGATVLGLMGFIPLFGVSIFGLSTFESGFVLTPRSIGMIAASLITSMMLPKWGYRWPMLVGAVITIITMIMLGMESMGISIFGAGMSGMVSLSIIMFLAGVAMGITAPAANNACIDLMPNRIATITGVRGMFRQSGGAVSIALTTLVLERFENIGDGFTWVFYGMAVILVGAIPFIFAMPKSGTIPPRKGIAT
ncbi:MAG: MFS transporter [Dehalococcoidales bacterium]|nr:MFS transporter [Dehalococcoidales bacterium]